jgi:hypothetical protein
MLSRASTPLQLLDVANNTNVKEFTALLQQSTAIVIDNLDSFQSHPTLEDTAAAHGPSPTTLGRFIGAHRAQFVPTQLAPHIDASKRGRSYKSSAKADGYKPEEVSLKTALTKNSVWQLDLQTTQPDLSLDCVK